MSQRVDLAATKKPVRDFIHDLGKIREPVELVLNGHLVAKIVPPSDLSDEEKRRILDKGWAAVEKARTNMRNSPTVDIQKRVDKAVREVRRRHGHRRH